MEKIKVGVAGVGKLGTYHIQNFMQIPSASLVAVHDINPERGNKVAEEFGLKYCQAFESLIEEVEAVTIAVPTVNHYELAAQALRSGRSVFIEKPIAATVEEGQELVDLSRKNSALFQAGHIERFNPAFRGLNLDDMNPMFIEAHRLASFDPRGSDVAVVLDLMIHDIDLVNTLVRSPIQRIDASGVSVISDSEDLANARLQFENGCVANLTASRISFKKMRKMRLFQPDSYTSMDLLQGFSEVYRLQNLPKDAPASSPIPWGVIEKNGVRKQISYVKVQAEEKNALKAELQSFVQANLQNERPVVSGEDGLLALQVAQQILDQIKLNHSKVSMV
ncbi:MAG: Gfo/Idh/MocA family oxidoreductase [bacterium]